MGDRLRKFEQRVQNLCEDNLQLARGEKAASRLHHIEPLLTPTGRSPLQSLDSVMTPSGRDHVHGGMLTPGRSPYQPLGGEIPLTPGGRSPLQPLLGDSISSRSPLQQLGGERPLSGSRSKPRNAPFSGPLVD